jgi:UDP-N-acetylmuramate: L-alanyl-gamma-D-glutamyl-meso-diaminopimelate ligase
MKLQMSSSNLKPGAHIHLIGICGTAMASLAGLLKDRGFKITGSDLNPYPPMSTQLESLGIQIQTPYSKSNLIKRPDFVIVGNVISANNEEAQELIRLDIPYTSLAQAMGEFIIQDRHSIVISGTHGKTTTTSLMAWVAECVGVQPGFLIGGIPKNFDRSFANPRGQFFVIEGDEYDTAYFDKVPKFTHYRPKSVVLTSIEFDHADIYPNLEAVLEAFSRLMRLVPKDGHLVAWAEDQNILSLLPQCSGQIVTYGLKAGDYRAENMQVGSEWTQFDVVGPKALNLGTYRMKLSGQYNILNALSVIALSEQLKWDKEKVRQALSSFQGVKRRQEIIGEPRGILVIEDFAHHPTAVRETLKGLKQKYPQKKIFAVFEPRSATSRRKVFQKDYVTAFQAADVALIAKAFDQSKIDEAQRFSTLELVEDMKASGQQANEFNSVDEIVSYLKSESRPGDLIVIMSNGGFDGIYKKLLDQLS